MNTELLCQWFARCGRPALGTTPHPALGDVPTCDRCHKFATGEIREDARVNEAGQVQS